MQRHEEVYDMIRDYEESDDATEDMLSLASEIDALTAERDRLAAENAELNAAYAQIVIDYEQVLDGLTESDATLDRLREVVPKVLPPHMSWKDSLDGARAILYPPETTNDDR